MRKQYPAGDDVTGSLYHLTGPEVAAALDRSPVAVIPFGSVEQHGPHLPTGTDTIAARLVAKEVAGRLDALFVPFGPYGITPLHAGHAGTVSLRRETFEALVTDVAEEIVAMGGDRLVFVNWHEGNIAALDSVAAEIQRSHSHCQVVSAQACYVAEQIYADQGGELTHGGGLETLAVLAFDRDLVRSNEGRRGSRSETAAAMDSMRRGREVYGYITDVTEIDPEGWYGDPGWADEERAADFAAMVAGEIVSRVRSIFQLRA